MTKSCKKCDAEDNDHMVACDDCNEWFHYDCVGVDSMIATTDWSCEFCRRSDQRSDSNSMSVPSTSSSASSSAASKRSTVSSAKKISASSAAATPQSTSSPLNVENEALNVASSNLLASDALNHLKLTSTSCYQHPIVTPATKTTATMHPRHWDPLSFPYQQSVATSNAMSAQHKQNGIGQDNLMQNNANNDISIRQSELQLKLLEEEEKKSKQAFIEKKYKLMMQMELENLGLYSVNNNTTADISNICAPTQVQLMARQSIPKSLPSFNGDPEDWPLFISSYETSTAVAGFSNSENLMRLQQCLKGKAKEMVRHKLLIPNMVPEIINTLKMCFGRPEFIIERMVDKVRKMAPPKDKLDALIEYALGIRNICATMEACNLTSHLNNPMLVSEFVEKLPNQYKMSWAMHVQDPGVPVVKTFSDWVYFIAEAASKVTSPASSSKRCGTVNTHSRTTEITKTCFCCEDTNHKMQNCDSFKKLPLERKWDLVKSKNLCRTCLNKHRQKCFLNKECGIDDCKIKHHPLLHKYNNGESKSGQLNSHTTNQHEEYTYFRIIPIRVHSNKTFLDTFAFLDEGSSVTLVEHHIFEYLGISGVKDPLCLKWTGETTRVEADSKLANIVVSNVYNGKKFKLENAHTVRDLNLPSQTINIENLKAQYAHLSGVQMHSYQQAKPTILIGANNWKLAIPLKVYEGSWHQPMATKTRLGWAIQGINSSSNKSSYLNIHQCDCEEKYETLHKLVKTSFNMDTVPPKTITSPEDARAIEILNLTCKKVGGRYEAGILWKYDNVELPNSYNTAFKRLMCLKHKAEKSPDLQQTLQKQIENLINKGYARKLCPQELIEHHSKVWYLPVFTTYNPNKPGRIRLVWDAAAKSNGYSLNDFVLCGPDLLNSLINVLLSFRVGTVAICGDIQEMFHQIRVKQSDIHVQRFLWFDKDDTANQPSTYVMQALTFGINCAPCIAHFVRDRNAEDFKDVYSRACESVQRYHYVDDLIDSTDSPEEALLLANQVKEIHAAAGFKIRNWVSNSKYVLEHLNHDNSVRQAPLELGSTEKILGMYFDPNKDVFKYIFRFARLKRKVLEDDLVPTKREVLQVLMSIFDPLGFVACYTIGLKILLQDIWRNSIGWDDEIYDHLLLKWNQWKSTLANIAQVEIPRCYSQYLKSASDVQLHTFVDAGESGYAAVCFLRISHAKGVSVSLVMAKSKVAPIKPMSIPRLELQATVIGVRVAKIVKNISRLHINSQYWWSDSKTVLKWLHMDPKSFQQFVMHRVGEILEETNVAQWRWVPSKINPADLSTKVMPKEKMHSWYEGPEFLKEEPNNWPVANDLGSIDTSEIRSHVFLIQKTKIPEIPLNWEYFSCWRRFYRALATFLAFIQKLKTASTLGIQKALKTLSITYEHIMKAKIIIFQQVQLIEYKNEIVTLMNNKIIDKSSKLAAYNIFLDADNLIRIRSRADSLNSEYNVIVLPPKHWVTFLIVRFYHVRFHHLGHETIINEIRGKYFIATLRALYKSVRRLCQHCKNNTAKPDVPQMAQLPTARLSCFERPFTFVGIDYFGPIYVSIGRRREKRWGVLFTCLTIRAIHIEIGHTLDTSSCVMCIRNFTSRRGTPREIFTDNGTNFKATEKILREEVKNMNLNDIVTNFDDIKWTFNPPAAPHMGGAWERLVRSVKSTLYAICPTMSFTDETLRSALLEAEFTLNARPLTFVALDAADDDALTPNHLLLGSSSGYKPIGSDSCDLRHRWRQTQTFADKFWRRWLKEYVPTIARRSKWFEKRPPIAVGNIVVIVDENLPRNSWPKGIISDVVLAKDGQVRKALVKTQNGTYERPTAKLAVLDVAKS